MLNFNKFLEPSNLVPDDPTASYTLDWGWLTVRSEAHQYALAVHVVGMPKLNYVNRGLGFTVTIGVLSDHRSNTPWVRSVVWPKDALVAVDEGRLAGFAIKMQSRASMLKKKLRPDTGLLEQILGADISGRIAQVQSCITMRAPIAKDVRLYEYGNTKLEITCAEDPHDAKLRICQAGQLAASYSAEPADILDISMTFNLQAARHLLSACSKDEDIRARIIAVNVLSVLPETQEGLDERVATLAAEVTAINARARGKKPEAYEGFLGDGFTDPF